MMHFWKCKFASFQAEKEEEECNCAENEECYHGECIGKEGYFNPIDGNVAIWSVNIPLSISKNTNNASRINVSRSERIVLIDVDIIVKKNKSTVLYLRLVEFATLWPVMTNIFVNMRTDHAKPLSICWRDEFTRSMCWRT